MVVNVGPFTGIGEEFDPSDESSDPKRYPGWFNGVHLPELQESTIAPFPDEATMRAGGSPAMGQSAFAWTQDTGTIWAWYSGRWRSMVSANGGAWTSKAVDWRYIKDGTLSEPLAMGTGSRTMRYSTQGKTVHFGIQLTRGANTNTGAGDYVFSTPTTPQTWNLIQGTATITQNSPKQGAVWRSATIQGIGGSRFALLLNDGSGKRLGTTTGSSDGVKGDGWSAGDIITINGTYEQK